MLSISVPRDESDVRVLVTGKGPSSGLILDTTKIKGAPKALRLLDCIYAVEGGTKVFLWWDNEKSDTLLLPIEGRGRLDLAPFGGVQNPREEGWTGHVSISVEGEGHFFLGLEFSKIHT